MPTDNNKKVHYAVTYELEGEGRNQTVRQSMTQGHFTVKPNFINRWKMAFSAFFTFLLYR